MASAVPSKRMVSSFFITLSSPHKATVTQQQQQPVLQAHSAPARDKQHAAVPVSPSDNIPAAARHKREDRSQSESYGSVDSKGQTRTGPSARTSDPRSPKPVQTSDPRSPKPVQTSDPRSPKPVQTSDPQSPKPVQPGSGRGKLQEDDRGDAELFPLPPPPPAALPSPLGTSLSDESALPPPPPAQTPLSRPLTSSQQPVYNREVETSTPSSGLKQDELSHGIHKNGQDASRESRDVCGFCRKPVALSEPAIEALNRTYHDGCFQCRSCHNPLAGKQYYNKAGIPLCEDCYQASLELCWACGDAITDHVIRALERAYHLTCFTCATCKKQIGEQAFAQGEVGEVYCLQDYYRKYAPKCNACKQLIIPKEDGTDSYNVKCMGHSYHENCYRCEVCVIQLSPEPNERGCYPLDGKMLCKSCHLKLVSEQH